MSRQTVPTDMLKPELYTVGTPLEINYKLNFSVDASKILR